MIALCSLMFFLEAGSPVHDGDHRSIRCGCFRNCKQEFSIGGDIVTMGSREVALTRYSQWSLEKSRRLAGFNRLVAFYRHGRQFSIEIQVIEFTPIMVPFRFDAAL